MPNTSTLPLSETSRFRRAPSQVMRLSRMGSSHPTRLSFLRSMIRLIEKEAWSFDRPVWELDSSGVGRAVYRAIGPNRTYSLVAFSHDLPSEMRTDRVIATAWDATFTFFDGTPEISDLDRLQQNVPLQEAGRVSSRELSLSRANRSVRLFDYVVECLADGKQPSADRLASTGYLMRTTAVYGTGKFGTADRSMICNRSELRAPFRAEMLSVWLTRSFTIDLVEHLAKAKGGNTAVPLHGNLRKILGVGNSTGLGMAPFLINHPILLNNWMMAREEALAQVRAQKSLLPDSESNLQNALNSAVENSNLWESEHPIQQKKLSDLRGDLPLIKKYIDNEWNRNSQHPWDDMWKWGESLTLEGQECLLSLILEPHGSIVDGFTDCMDADESSFFRIDGTMRLSSLSNLLKTNYSWALSIDFSNPTTRSRFWYVSQEKLEPRMGERESDDGQERELPLCIAYNIHKLATTLADWSQTDSVAKFLLRHPEHRMTIRRVQFSSHHPYAEIQDNLSDVSLLPIDLLRCKLAFFGATRFDPRSDLWVRISLFQGLPYPSDFTAPNA